MKTAVSALLLTITGLAAAAGVAAAGQAALGHGHEGHEGPADGAFHAVMDHYEAIRQALLHDHARRVDEHARAVRERVVDLKRSLDASAERGPAAETAQCLALLPRLEEAAGELEQAATLAEAREAFHALSGPMIEWRDMGGVGHRPVVVHCSMVDRSWLQPEGEIGNPYQGQSMARCGEVVSR